MTTLLLGMGNPILSDDAVGVRLARDLAADLEGTRDLEIEPECSTGGLHLLDLLRGHSRAIIIDALETREGEAGDWHHFDARALRDTVHLTNIHDANFATVLELGRRLGIALPRAEDIHLFVVEVEDARTFSETMTPALEKRYPSLSQAILTEVRSLIGASHAERS